MSVSTLLRNGSLVVVCFLSGQLESRAESSESAQLTLVAGRFNFELSRLATETKQESLGASFRETFRKKRDLNADQVSKYFKSNPTELLAFKDYLQVLHDSSHLSHDETIQLLESAVRGFADNVDFVALTALKSETDTTKSNDLNVKTGQSATEIAIQREVRAAQLPDTPKDQRAQLSFGQKLEDQEEIETQKELKKTIARLEREQERQRLEAQAAFLMQQLAQSNDRKQTLLERVNSILNQHAERVVQQEADAVFDNAEISITSTDKGPELNARVLKAFDPNRKDGFFNYGELGMVDIDDRQTLNIGFGIRALDPTERVMYGANVFFDQEFPYDHQRASIGIEMATSPFRFNANRYYALSGAQNLSGGVIERGLSGHDMKSKIAFPYLPGLFLDYSKFKWFGKDGLSDIQGQTIGISGALSQSLSMEIARKVYSNDDYTSENSARLTYRYIPGSTRSASIFAPIAVPYTLEKLDAREKYAMTNRENEIQKQQTSPGLQVTFTSL